MGTSQRLETMPDQLTFFAEELPVRISPSPDSERDWMERVATSRSNSLNLLAAYGPVGWYGRTSPASCRLTEEGRLEPSSGVWENSGMGSPTEFLTLSTSEFHSGAVASSLSDILETGDLPQRYYLSATACKGILCRAEKRGQLASALTSTGVGTCGADGGSGRMDFESETFVTGTFQNSGQGYWSEKPEAQTIGTQARALYESTLVTHALRGDGFDASEDGTGRGTSLVPHVSGMAVRRLTPGERERLQGFRDDYTLIQYRGKPAADGPRYRAIGNSWAVPVPTRDRKTYSGYRGRATLWQLRASILTPARAGTLA